MEEKKLPFTGREKIRFNVPPFTGREYEYVRQAVENQKIWRRRGIYQKGESLV